MRVLVVGSGGREHALAWALSASPLLTALFVAPGNPGTAAFATNVGLAAMDIAGLARFAKGEGIELGVVGPEGAKELCRDALRGLRAQRFAPGVDAVKHARPHALSRKNKLRSGRSRP